jgi:hypothetical protein
LIEGMAAYICSNMHLHLAADEVGGGGRTALVGRVDHVDAGGGMPTSAPLRWWVPPMPP